MNRRLWHLTERKTFCLTSHPSSSLTADVTHNPSCCKLTTISTKFVSGKAAFHQQELQFGTIQPSWG